MTTLVALVAAVKYIKCHYIYVALLNTFDEIMTTQMHNAVTINKSVSE